MWSEAGGDLEVERVVESVLGGVLAAAVVGERVVQLEDEILSEIVVGSESIVRFETVPSFCGAVAVVASIDFEVLHDGCAECGIPRIGTAGLSHVSGDAADTAHVFSSHGPVTFIFHTGSPADAFHFFLRVARSVGIVFLVDVGSVPAESTDTEVFDGRNPESADEVLLFVFVGVVDSLTVEDANLIVQPFVSVFCGEEVTLHLESEVTS